MSRKKLTLDKNNLKKIGSRIRLLRRSLGYNQTDFAKTIGISQAYLSDVELGKFEPSTPILYSIENKYSLTPESILKGEGFSLAKLEKYRTIEENKEELPINDKETGYNEDRDNKKAIFLEMTSEILDSNTEYARALETNINAFHLAITDKIKHKNNHEKLKNNHEKLKKNHEKLKERVEDLEKKDNAVSA